MDLEIFVLFLLEAECANALTHKSDGFHKAATHTHTHTQIKQTLPDVTWLPQLGYSEGTHLHHLQSQRYVQGNISRFRFAASSHSPHTISLVYGFNTVFH